MTLQKSVLAGRHASRIGLALLALWADAAGAAGPDSLYAATLDDLDGKSVALERYKGKPAIVNFWARWCGPCRVEIPELAKVHTAHGKDIAVIGIAVEEEETRESVRDFAKAYDMDYQVLVGDNRKTLWLMQALGNTQGGLPFTVVIDRKGQIVSRKLGAMNAKDLRDAVEHLKAAEPAKAKP